MENQFYETYRNASDEELIEIIQAEVGQYAPAVKEAATKILEERGFEIEYEETESLSTTDENRPEKNDYWPFILSVSLLAFQLYRASVIYNYKISGTKNPRWLFDYIVEMGVFHDILVRVIVILVVLYCRQKQNDKIPQLVAWCIACLIFGGWVLFIAGIIEAVSSYDESGEQDIDYTIIGRIDNTLPTIEQEEI